VEVVCDQAIFTSIRSATGEGYRIVAASPGLRPEEKAEITRKSPSHGSLAASGAIGMLAYPLPTGRFCVSHSQNAGAEYTARGGERVWTQIVVLDRDTYLAFGRNPARVHRVLGQAAKVSSSKSPVPHLERLTLRAWNHVELSAPSYSPESVAPFIRVMSSLLRGVKWVLAGATNPESMLEWAFDAIPLWARTGVSVSSGLGFSMSRVMQINMVIEEHDSVARMIRGHDIRWCDLTGTIELEPSAFDHWLALVRTAAIEGRLKAATRLAGRMFERTEPAALQRLVELHRDTEAARKSDVVATEMRRRYAAFVPDGALETELLVELRKITDPLRDQPAVPAKTMNLLQASRRVAAPTQPPKPRP
jgi:hypothetical protein